MNTQYGIYNALDETMIGSKIPTIKSSPNKNYGWVVNPNIVFAFKWDEIEFLYTKEEPDEVGSIVASILVNLTLTGKFHLFAVPVSENYRGDLLTDFTNAIELRKIRYW